MSNNNEANIESIEARLDAISAQLEVLTRREQAYRDVIDEFSPILRKMMGVGSERLAEVEERGYFRFAKHTQRIVDTVVTSYDDEDLEQLGDNIVYLIDTLREFTQPDMVELAREAAEAVKDDPGKKPKSLLGMLKAARNPDTRRGLALVLNMLRHVGRTSAKTHASKSRAKRLESRLAPSLRRRALPPAGNAPPRPTRPRADAEQDHAAGTAAAAPTPAGGAKTLSIPGYEMSSEGFLVDAGTWTREFAAAIAAEVGYELSDAHWQLIEWLQSEYAASGASPNVRRIGVASPVATKQLYTMFPSAPAMEAARLAGLPKPVGCV